MFRVPWRFEGDYQGFRKYFSFIMKSVNITLIIFTYFFPPFLYIIGTGFIFRINSQ